MAKKSTPPTRADVEPLIAMYRSKQFGEGIKAAQKFIKRWPDTDFGWIMLGACFESLEKFDESLEAYRRATKLNPENHDVLNNYGNVLRITGDLAQAKKNLIKAVEVNPKHHQAFYNLGLTLIGLGEFEQAEHAFISAIELDSGFADAHNYLGNIYKQDGKFDQAIESYQKAIDAMPGQAGFHKNLGDAQLNKGMVDEAERTFKNAVDIDPNSSSVLGSLGNLYLRKEDLEEAERVFRKAILIEPKFAQNRNNLGIALVGLGRMNEAEQEYRTALELKQDSSLAYHNLGNLALDTNRLEEGLEYHQKVCEIDPNSFSAFRNLGVTQAVLGDPKGAEKSYHRALSLNPNNAEVYYRLSEVKNFSKGDKDLEKIEELISEGNLNATDSTFLHYAAGKAYADFGDQVTQSFYHYSQGARTKRRSSTYNVSRDEALFAEIARVFTKDRISEFLGAGLDTRMPVFVIGMPRSGTTLVEHILASHSAVFGMGERYDVQRLVRQLNQTKGQPFPEWINGFTRDDFLGLGTRYWSGIQELAPAAGKIVDKMPNNFRYPGVIAGMLSGAKIIHVRRNPIDTCLSCYTHLFEDAQEFSYDQGDLGRFYRAYSQLADHWMEVLPSDLYHEVRYEDIVLNPEDSIRTMLDHCELDWESSCLEFHKTQRAVPTASLAQVRQPLYNNAMERWKPYEQHLQPLIEALGDLV